MDVVNIQMEEGVQQSTVVSDYNHRTDICLTIRILFDGPEIGNVIGKGGETVQYIRYKSGAQVKISDISSPERIVTITGTSNEICKATELILLKVEEFFYRLNSDWKDNEIPLTLSLIVPAPQCDFIIGKGGCKIREIRKLSGTAILVKTDMLPNSTERLVSISGTSGTVHKCVHHVCNVLINTLPCNASIPYEPCTISLDSNAVSYDFQSQHTNRKINLAALGLGTASTGGINQAALAALAGSQLRTDNRQNKNEGGEHKNQNSNSNTETISMIVPNDLIGCIIGKKGSIITEIRKISGAYIYIYKGEATYKNTENVDRQIKITGSKDSISVAKYLIETSLKLHKGNSSYGTDDGSSLTLPIPPIVASPPSSSITPLANLFAKPRDINAISSLYPTDGLTHPIGPLKSTIKSTLIQTTGVNHLNSCLLVEKTKSDRNKSAPYWIPTNPKTTSY